MPIFRYDLHCVIHCRRSNHNKELSDNIECKLSVLTSILRSHFLILLDASLF